MIKYYNSYLYAYKIRKTDSKPSLAHTVGFWSNIKNLVLLFYYHLRYITMQICYPDQIISVR
jgi:hypothetical protein